MSACHALIRHIHAEPASSSLPHCVPYVPRPGPRPARLFIHVMTCRHHDTPRLSLADRATVHPHPALRMYLALVIHTCLTPSVGDSLCLGLASPHAMVPMPCLHAPSMCASSTWVLATPQPSVPVTHHLSCPPTCHLMSQSHPVGPPLFYLFFYLFNLAT